MVWKRISEWQIAQGFAAVEAGLSWAAAVEGLDVSWLTLQRRWKDAHAMSARKRVVRAGSLTEEEREEIRLGIELGLSNAEIGRRLGRHRSTVGREIDNHGGRSGYRAWRAHEEAGRSAKRRRLRWWESRPHVWAEVVARLREGQWSPRQISEWLRKQHPDERDWWVSHESIYQAIYLQPRGELRKELVACLRTERSRRKAQKRAVASDRNRMLAPMVNISQRPPEAADRAVPGFWEGDLIIGKGSKSQVATLVERTTRFGMLVKLDSRDAAHVAERLAVAIKRLPAELRRALTWDQGIEMARHDKFSLEADMAVYFCDPHSPWQRGSNENWNGLVRQYLKKGTDLSTWSQAELDEFAARLNGRPRQTLDWDTPAERFNQLVATTT